MRMRNVCEKVPTLENLKEKFLLVKQSQHTGELAMRDYRNCLADFLKHSQNSVSYEPLEQDTLRYFAAIPATSPARYNKPFQNVNAFFNWLVSQEYLSKNPLKANGLKKRKDDGNVKPASIEALQSFLKALDRKSYTGMRDYAIIVLMLDTGIRTRELLNLHNSDFDAKAGCIAVSKLVAKTRKTRTVYLSAATVRLIADFQEIKPQAWDDWLFPNYEGKQLKVDHLDKAFLKYSQKSGIKITPYQLRHSFATLFLKNGGDVFSLQHLMSHSDLRMTKRYTELDERYIEQQHRSYSPALLLGQKSTQRIRKI